MPSAPRFHVTQDAAFVYVHVHVPYVRVSEMEFHVETTHFTFYCKPYLLKVQFPHEVVDNELAKAVYDPNKENGTIVVHLPKQEPGLDFPDLDLLTKLLQPKKTPQVDLKAKCLPAPLIEVLESTNGSSENVSEATTAQFEEATASAHGDSTLLELEKRFEQVTQAEEASYHVQVTELKPSYGFNSAYTDVFRGWHGEASEILSLPNPDETPVKQRRSLRETGEDAHFDIERYLLDFANKEEDEYFAMAMTFAPYWRSYPIANASAPLPLSPPPPPPPTSAEKSETKKPLIMEVVDATETTAPITQQISHLTLTPNAAATPPPSTMASSVAEATILTDADRELLLRLPNKEFLITCGSGEETVLLGGLVDILIGYVYEQLTTQGDSGVESTWTISILSPTLSWLDSSADVSAVIRSSVRRMLTFPLLRQYDLAIHVIRETAELLRRGKRVVLHSLLDLYRIVEKSETQYLLNAVYVQDYCIWIQSASDERLVRLADELCKCLSRFTKAETGWALEEMERQLQEEDGVANDGSELESSSSDSSASDESDDEEESESDDEEDEDEDGNVDDTNASIRTDDHQSLI